MPESGWFRP